MDFSPLDCLPMKKKPAVDVPGMDLTLAYKKVRTTSIYGQKWTGTELWE